MKPLIRAVALIALTLSTVVSAQVSPQGVWEGALEDANGAVPFQLEIRVQGEEATGPFVIEGAEQYISQGKIVADGIEFKTARLRQTDRDVAYVWVGAISGDAITFSVTAEDREGAAREFIVRRPTP